MSLIIERQDEENLKRILQFLYKMGDAEGVRSFVRKSD
jgi:hypothetical protein